MSDPGFPSQGCQPLKSDGNLLTMLFTKPLSSILPVVRMTSETILATGPIHGFRDGMVEQWNSTRQSHGTARNHKASGFVNNAVNGSHLPLAPPGPLGESRISQTQRSTTLGQNQSYYLGKLSSNRIIY